MEVVENFIKGFLYIGYGLFFILAVICLIKIDEDVKITDKDFCIASLFVLPVFWIIFILDIVYDILISDLSLIPVETIFICLVSVEICLMAKTVRR